MRASFIDRLCTTKPIPPDVPGSTGAARCVPVTLILASGMLLIGCCKPAAAGDAPAIDFDRDVRPILSHHCFACHGPDAAQREAGLRLDVAEEARGELGSGAPIVPGRPDRSPLVERIFHEDPDLRMPPADAPRELSDSHRQMLRRWIAEGAVWEAHWAFVPPESPPLPAVQTHHWPRNAIDRFVLARLEGVGLEPSPEASRETWLRRVTLDLTGLPPTPEELDRFLSASAPNAYEKVVDRLLHSERYGETMALGWLEAARYADTDGYQNDGPRSMWRWRDWVIEAYNANLPFDQFTIEQLAGDLLPGATLAQQIATGFNRNHRYNSEAGLVLEEFLLENAVDRVDTTATVWMGLTMGCARCHDHKFDPFSQQDYYRLIAYFDNVPESGRAVKFGNSEPWVTAPTRAQQAALAERDAQVAAARQALAAADAETGAALARWQREAASGDSALTEPLVPRGLTGRFEFADKTAAPEAQQAAITLCDGPRGGAWQLSAEGPVSLGKVGRFRCEQPFSLALWMRPDETGEGVVLSRQDASTRRPGVAVELADGRLRFSIITRWVAGVGSVETLDPLPSDAWTHVALTNDGSQSARGMHIYLDGHRVPTRILHNTNSNTGGHSAGALLRVGGGVHGRPYRGAIDDLQIYDRALWEDEVTALAVRRDLREIFAAQPAERTDAEHAVLQRWFLEHAAPEPLRALARGYADARWQREKYWRGLPTTMVMSEIAPPRPTHVRIRGSYDQLGDEVRPGVPENLGPGPPEDIPRNRLGFARWLTGGRHPLTARVAVNRYWQRYFGTGLVKTAEDFGLQGEPPSHPQLLDWLACEFVASGWDVKRMQRRIVLSATYRQASRAAPELRERDPGNRLLARAPRIRLPAQVVRDQALALGGLLAPGLGGPSVSPHQPPGLWAEMSNMKYRPGKGGELYRRSLYTIWKRTVAPPSMALLDAADRESCTVLVRRTNTPLQALALLNEHDFFEAARGLARRMLATASGDPLAHGFRLATARQPTPTERQILQQTYDRLLETYRTDPTAAERLIASDAALPETDAPPAELAACTAVANLLLNLDEVVTQH